MLISIYVLITTIVICRNLKWLEVVLSLGEEEIADYGLKKSAWEFGRRHYICMLTAFSVFSLFWPIKIIIKVIVALFH